MKPWFNVTPFGDSIRVLGAWSWVLSDSSLKYGFFFLNIPPASGLTMFAVGIWGDCTNFCYTLAWLITGSWVKDDVVSTPPFANLSKNALFPDNSLKSVEVVELIPLLKDSVKFEGDGILLTAPFANLSKNPLFPANSFDSVTVVELLALLKDSVKVDGGGILFMTDVFLVGSWK